MQNYPNSWIEIALQIVLAGPMQRACTMVVLALGANLFDLALMPASAASEPNPQLAYFGTYTGQKSKGIYVARFDAKTGKFSAPEWAADTRNPSFLAIHPNHRWLYAAGEVDSFGGKPGGVVGAFRIDPKSGRLERINEQPSGGAGPCHVAVDHTGKCLLVANYGSGSVAVLPIDAEGRLGTGTSIQHHGSSINPQRQEGPHAHFIIPDPGNQFALACDLGLDKVLVYRLNPEQPSLVANTPPCVSLKPGSGPRHLVFAPNGRFVYVINEMGSSITTFSYDAHAGSLKELETHSTLPPEFRGQNSCAEIQVHPSGKFIYGSNRGHNSIAVFRVNPKDGRLQRTECVSVGGKTPRHFAIDPSGKWLLAENQDSDGVASFAIDSATGHLTTTGETTEVGAPVCLVFVP